MEKEALQSALSSFERWQIFFALFVAIGVAGEFALGWVHFNKSKRLRAIEQSEARDQEEKIQLLRKENLTLLVGVSDRMFKDQDAAAERLHKYAGTKTVITYVDIKETASLARQIAYVLKRAGLGTTSSLFCAKRRSSFQRRRKCIRTKC